MVSPARVEPCSTIYRLASQLLDLTVDSVHCTLYSIQYTVYTIYIAQSTVLILHNTMNTTL